MNINELKAAYHKAYGQNANIDFNVTAGYSTGIIIQKALATTESMSQLALRKAIFALSGKFTTVEGHFKLTSDGSQVGMLLPIGQLQRSGHAVKLVPLYPSAVARGKAIWAGAQ